MTELVETTREGRVVEIHLNRPAKRNALTGPMYTALVEGLRAAEADPDVCAVVLAGRGAAFCAGNDLHDFLGTPPDDDSPVFRFLRTLTELTVPLVAAVQGPAVGIGATMLLHGDHVVADETAFLHYPFVPLGLVPEAASSLLLPRVVGPLRAAEILLLAEPVPAREAHDLGLVSAVVPAGTQLTAARGVAGRLAAQPPQALRVTKRLLRSEERSVPGRLLLEGQLLRECLAGAEFAAAATAYVSRREPPP